MYYLFLTGTIVLVVSKINMKYYTIIAFVCEIDKWISISTEGKVRGQYILISTSYKCYNCYIIIAK